MNKSILLSILFLGSVSAFDTFGADLSEIEALAAEHAERGAAVPSMAKRPSRRAISYGDSGTMATEAVWRLQSSKRNKARHDRTKAWRVAELEAYLEDEQRALMDAEGVTLEDIFDVEDAKVAADEPSGGSVVVLPDTVFDGHSDAVEDAEVVAAEPSDASSDTSSVVTPALSLPFIAEMIERRKANELAMAEGIDEMPAGAFRSFRRQWKNDTD